MPRTPAVYERKARWSLKETPRRNPRGCTARQPSFGPYVFLTICGVPFSWNKTQGGDEIRWIGYHILLSFFSPRATESRSKWATDWLERVATSGCVRGDELRSAVGRLPFITGALEVEKPFPAPLYSFLSRGGSLGLFQLPLYERLVAHFLANHI